MFLRKLAPLHSCCFFEKHVVHSCDSVSLHHSYLSVWTIISPVMRKIFQSLCTRHDVTHVCNPLNQFSTVTYWFQSCKQASATYKNFLIFPFLKELLGLMRYAVKQGKSCSSQSRADVRGVAGHREKRECIAAANKVAFSASGDFRLLPALEL